MENISVNKKRRGRPTKYTEEDYEAFFSAFPAKTRRGRQNYIAIARALKILRSQRDRFAYLLTPRFRRTILAELGRVDNPAVIITLADEICASRMNTARAVGRIRRSRGKGVPSFFTLGRAIESAIERHCERYHTASTEEISFALEYVSNIYNISLTASE